MRIRAGPAAILLAFLLLAPPACAQVPPTPSPGAASVEVHATTEPVAVSVDKPSVVTITIANTEQPTGTPLDMGRLVALSREGVPEGWNAAFDVQSFMLKPGESRQAQMTLSVSPGALDTARITVTAKAYARGVNSVPVAGPNVDPEALAHADVRATRADSPQRVLLETVGPYLWLLLLALVAAFVLIVSLVAANRRVAVRLSASEPQHSVLPGSRTVFPVVVQNITRREDSVVLRVAGAEGWATFLPTPQLDLEGGQQEEVPIVIIAPKDAVEGTRQPFTVSAISAQAPRRPASVVLEAEVSAPRRRKDAKAAPAEAQAPADGQ